MTMLPINVLKKVFENNCRDSYSIQENLISVIEENRTRLIHPRRTMPVVIPNENHEVKILKNNENKNDLKAVEFVYNAYKISINHLLNDDCLLHIFSFLPYCDLIKIERVCKRWQRLSFESWTKVKFVNIYQDFGISALQINHLEQILSRCGNYITGLEFKCSQNIMKAHNIVVPKYSRGIDGATLRLYEVHEYLASKKYRLMLRKETKLFIDEAIKLINSYCKKLNFLNIFHAFVITEIRCLNFLDSNILKNLKSLAVVSQNYDQDQLSDVLKKCVNLKELNVNSYGFRRNELMCLSETCTTLAVPFSRTFFDDMLDEVLKKYQNLENLDISGTVVVPSTLIPFTKQFKCLTLWSMKNFFRVDIENFNQFYCPNLRVLDLTCNGSTLTGVILSVLIHNCPNIEDLRLKMCKSLKVADFSVLKNLENLMYLDVSFTTISSETLIDLSEILGKLKKLECYGCSNVDSNGISKIIDASPELTYLSISKSMLTKPLIESALMSLQERYKKVDLTVCISERNDEIIAAKIRRLIEELELKSTSYEYSSKNTLRIVYGSSVCDCNFYKTCFCSNGFITAAYFC